MKRWSPSVDCAEGVASIAQAVGLLLAQPPPGKSLDEALAMLRGSGLVSLLASAAPFAVIAPLASNGYVGGGDEPAAGLVEVSLSGR